MVTTRRMASAKDVNGDKPQTIPKQVKKNSSNGIKGQSASNWWSIYKGKVKKSAEESWAMLTDARRCTWWPFPIFLLLAEMCINPLIIETINYTEIDWKAYMQVSRKGS